MTALPITFDNGRAFPARIRLQQGFSGLLTALTAGVIAPLVTHSSSSSWLAGRIQWIAVCFGPISLNGKHRMKSDVSLYRYGNRDLSDRECQIIALVARGLKNRDIAKSIGITEAVVKNYLRRIYDKVGVWNRVELALWYESRQHAKPSPQKSDNVRSSDQRPKRESKQSSPTSATKARATAPTEDDDSPMADEKSA